MLGPPKLRLLDQPVTVSLEDLVPPDNFYRFLDVKLDLSFARTWVQDRYAERGRPSIDPVVFFKLQLILFFEGLRSERKLMQTVALNLAHRWYLGYHLDEPLPDHSSLTRIRERLGLPLFERFFAHVVRLCHQAGLVWGAELFFDGTKVRANADIDSLTPRWYVAAKAHLDTLFGGDAPASTDPEAAARADGEARLTEEQGADLPSSAPPDAPTARMTDSAAPVALPFAGTAEDEQTLAEANAATWKLLDAHRLDPARPPSGPYRRITDFRVSTTDPDATPLGKGHEGKLGYHDHYVVDGGRLSAPSSCAWPARWRTSAERNSALLGTHATNGHSPPTRSASTIATRHPGLRHGPGDVLSRGASAQDDDIKALHQPASFHTARLAWFGGQPAGAYGAYECTEATRG